MLRVEEERTQLYLALKKSTTPSVRLAFYDQFSIEPSAKKKKRKVWRHTRQFLQDSRGELTALCLWAVWRSWFLSSGPSTSS